MRRLIARRAFGAGLGGTLALALLPRSAPARNAAQEVTLHIRRFAFVPDRVLLRPGDSLRIVNEDIAPHTVTALSGAWDSGSLDRGGQAVIVFDRAGEHPFRCAWHPQMTGTVVVRP